MDYSGQGAQDVHLDFHTAPEFSEHTSSPLPLYNRHDWLGVNNQLNYIQILSSI